MHADSSSENAYHREQDNVEMERKDALVDLVHALVARVGLQQITRHSAICA